MSDFPKFGSIPRLNKPIVITEKIDGTNGLVSVESLYQDGRFDDARFSTHTTGADGVTYAVYAGSRNRWISPYDDNFGFAQWVHDHAHDLVNLGVGKHYGEWWGKGIGRNYGLDHRRFSLFNVSRWSDETRDPVGETRPKCCGVVPVVLLADGATMSIDVEIALSMLKTFGSFAVPGFDRPEGVVVYHTAANALFKVTLEGDNHKAVLKVRPGALTAAGANPLPSWPAPWDVNATSVVSFGAGLALVGAGRAP